jgi:hypothetical protein
MLYNICFANFRGGGARPARPLQIRHWYVLVFVLVNSRSYVVRISVRLCKLSGGGVRGVRPPLKFAKHMLYNIN